MQKILKALPLAIMLVLTASCWHDYEYEYNPDAAITSFSVGNYRIWYYDVNVNGHDTLVCRYESGAYHPFIIDQKNNLIYNPDSLPYGAEVNKLITSVSGEGALYYQLYHSDDTFVDTLYTASDTIDFSRPLNFTVVSTDETYIRKYKVTVNAHTMDPDSVKWKQVAMTGYSAPKSAKAFVRNDSLFVIGTDDNGQIVMSSCKTNEKQWNTQATDLTASADPQSATLFNGKFYILDGGKLMASVDGTTWTDADSDTELAQIISFSGSAYDEGIAWAVSKSGQIVSSTDMATWTAQQDLPEGFPTQCITGFSEPLANNSAIIRRTIIGIDGNSTEDNAVIFNMISTEKEFVKMVPSGKEVKPCPRLKNLAVINYDGEFYSFGLDNWDGSKYAPFQGFWQSSDHGLSWRDCSKMTDEYSTWNYKMKMPAGLIGKNSGFVYTTDANGYIWIITENNGIWRGAINRLVK